MAPFFVIPMPLDKDGKGPAAEADTVRTLWQVWDADNTTMIECESQGMAQVLAELLNRVAELEAAIRKHMGYRGDDRCFQDDHELYQVLPEGDTRPPVDTAVTIDNCRRYIERRQCADPAIEYVSPQRRIEELEARCNELQDLLTSARAIAERRGEETAWERFSKRLERSGIGCITAKVFKILPSDLEAKK